MKKVRIIILFMTLFLGMLFLFPAKVFASTTSYGTAEDWFNHISQFDFGLAKGEITFDIFDDFFGLLIVEEPSGEFDGLIFEYVNWNVYFESKLATRFNRWWVDGEDLLFMLENVYGENFDGYLYWNFEEQYWQVEYYEASELDYYKQRVDELEDEISSLEDEIQQLEDEISSLEDEISSLEDEISSLEDEISSLEDEISSLEDEISSLEDEISTLEDEISSLENQISSLQNMISSLEDEISSLEDEISLLEDEISSLENALDLEYDRGYNEGYEVGYNEGLLVENNDIDIIKWFVPLVVVIIVVGIIEPIIILKRRG